MSLQSIYYDDNINVTVNEQSKQVMLELNSGGLRANYVTVHMGKAETERLIEALQAALRHLEEK
ncbi:hypothetical protein [Paenibacillus koleovorans]|uniref:hypothetical protein n=1 Tax=Paenibacillus koleovorans TaxID=121608 RepID=UPI000FD84A02|nr:hypothetical protein [Paenibacillus koleovorans]